MAILRNIAVGFCDKLNRRRLLVVLKLAVAIWCWKIVLFVKVKYTKGK